MPTPGGEQGKQHHSGLGFRFGSWRTRAEAAAQRGVKLKVAETCLHHPSGPDPGGQASGAPRRGSAGKVTEEGLYEGRREADRYPTH